MESIEQPGVDSGYHDPRDAVEALLNQDANEQADYMDAATADASFSHSLNSHEANDGLDEYQADSSMDSDVEEERIEEQLLDDESAMDDLLELVDDAVFLIDGEKINGQQLKSQRMMQSDYTRKTQDLARQKQELDAEREHTALAFQYMLGNERQKLDELQQSVDWQQLQMVDPASYQHRVQQLQQQAAVVDQVEQSFAQFVDHMHDMYAVDAEQRAEQAVSALYNGLVPEWSNTVYQQVHDYAVEQGMPSDQFNSIDDALPIAMMWKAMQYDLAQGNIKTQPFKKSVRSSTSKTASRSAKAQRRGAKKQALKRLKNSGSLQDAAAALLG